MKEKILSLLKENKSYNEIVDTLGVSKSTISYHAKRTINGSRSMVDPLSLKQVVAGSNPASRAMVVIV